MAETANIARMADKASKEIFEAFGWTRKKLSDTNWPCVTDTHVRRGGQGAQIRIETHPTDAVFRYDDPYQKGIVYLNADVKSYGSDSITTTSMGKAIRSLCFATECANVSEEWQRLYAGNDHEYRVCGLLFIYNHDHVYDAEKFARNLNGARSANFRLSGQNRVFVVGPAEIKYLATVANDLTANKGRIEGLRYEWVYPDLVQNVTKRRHAKAASIETLLGPWQVAAVSQKTDDGPVDKGIRVYYRGSGEDPDEFEYFFEFLFRYQLLDGRVDLLLPQPHKNAATSFETARERMVSNLRGLKEIEDRLAKVKYASVTNVVQVFNGEEIGMER